MTTKSKITDSSNDRMTATVTTDTRYGDGQIDFEFSRSSWMENGLKLVIKPRQRGIEIEMDLVDDCLEHLIDMLYRVKLWTPTEEEAK